MPFLETIFNRSELRIGGKGSITIATRKDLQAKDPKLQFILGGGLQFLPKLTAREEAFIRVGNDGKQVDSIGCNKTAARTAIGITVDDHFLILIMSQVVVHIALMVARHVPTALPLVKFHYINPDLGLQA